MTGVSTAIDMQCLAGDEVSVLEVEHSLDNFLDRAHAADGMQRGEEVVRFGRVHRCPDDARRIAATTMRSAMVSMRGEALDSIVRELATTQ